MNDNKLPEIMNDGTIKWRRKIALRTAEEWMVRKAEEWMVRKAEEWMVKKAEKWMCRESWKMNV